MAGLWGCLNGPDHKHPAHFRTAARTGDSYARTGDSYVPDANLAPLRTSGIRRYRAAMAKLVKQQPLSEKPE